MGNKITISGAESINDMPQSPGSFLHFAFGSVDGKITMSIHDARVLLGYLQKCLVCGYLDERPEGVE